MHGGPFTDPEVLALDEWELTTCWAWEQLTLDPRISGILFNEVRLDGDGDDFRRTAVPVTRAELVLAGRQLGREVLDMLDAGLWPYPNPTPEWCACAPSGLPAAPCGRDTTRSPSCAPRTSRAPTRPGRKGASAARRGA